MIKFDKAGVAQGQSTSLVMRGLRVRISPPAQMASAVINVGSEILTGDIQNTNFSFLAQKLEEEGIEVGVQITLGDRVKDISKFLKDLLRDYWVVVITGGLGPTEDDVTKEAIAEATGLPLIRHREALRIIRERLSEKGRKMLPSQEKMGMLPKGSIPIPNRVGLAPGIFLEWEGRKIIALPGVPEEMMEMWREVRKYLSKERNVFYKHRVLRVWGLSEAEINEKLKDLLIKSDPQIILTTTSSGVDVRIKSRGGSPSIAESKLEEVEEEVKKRLGDYVYSADTNMENVVGMLLKLKGKTISVAESCTGGLVSKKLTNVPGSSVYFIGGMVTYSNQSKKELLGVAEETLLEKGAVSEEVCSEMAKKVREKFNSHLGASVTGIAGPTGGTPHKPVGLVFTGLSDGNKVWVEKHIFSGNRDQVREKASQAVLDMVRRYLLEVLR